MRVKVRTQSGNVIEQEVFNISDRVKNLKNAKPAWPIRSPEEKARHDRLAARRRLERLVNANCGPSWRYSTLTQDNANEVHTYEEAALMLENYRRRLRTLNPKVKIIAVMGRGKNTNRIHFHMLSEGVTEEQIREKWTAGLVTRITPLRERNHYEGINYGRDYTGLARYLFEHWEPEQGRRHWRQTANLEQPKREEPTIPKIEYSEKHPPRAPKGYRLVETKATKWGYLYFKYVADEPTRRRARKC